MKFINLKKIAAFVFVIGCAVFISGTSLFAFMPDTNGPRDKKGESDLIPGEFIVKFKEGANIQGLAAKIGVNAESIGRVCRIAPAVAKYKVAKLKKDSEGWYWFMGKKYEDLKDVSDEEVFELAYNDMPQDEKGLYRIYLVKLPAQADTIIKLPNGKEESKIASIFRNDPDVEYSQPNFRVKALWAPNDPRYAEQWSHRFIGSESAWDITQGNGNVVIAIVDSGVDYNHEDLAANIWSNSDEIPGNGIDDDNNGYVDDARGYDFSNNDPDPMDDAGHGTHCAGIAAAVANNGKGIAGVCPNAKIMPVKFLDANGSGSLEVAISAIKYAADNGANVISNSWGGETGYMQPMEDAVNYAYNRGCFLTAAAGNDAKDTVAFTPANCRNMFAVGAFDYNYRRAYFSNFGTKVDVSAPGMSILSTLPNNSYGSYSGTSMACPHVAGEAALILSRYTNYTAAQAANAIRSGTIADLISPEYVGTGRIMTVDALNVSNATECKARISEPLYAVRLGGNIPIMGTATGTSYTVKYATYPYAPPELFSSIGQGGSVNEGLLVNFNTAGITDDEYYIKLTVTDSAGNNVSNMTKIYLDQSVSSGWPKSAGPATDANIFAYPVCADFNNDGTKELLVVNHLGGKMHLWRSDATSVAGWPKDLPANETFLHSPAVADLDGDGKLEIVLISNFLWPSVYIWRFDGTALPGWPKQLSMVDFQTALKVATSAPVIGDINGDGQQEIVLFAYNRKYFYENRLGSVQVYAWDINGNILAGWPHTLADINCRYWSYPQLAVGDINNDGKDEVLFGSSEGEQTLIHAIDGDALPLPGWPRQFDITSTRDENAYHLSIGDVNNDGYQEIVFGTWMGKLFVLDRNGDILSGWPMSVSSNVIDQIALADLDNDNDLELIVATIDGQLGAYHHNGELVSGWNTPGGGSFIVARGGNSDIYYFNSLANPVSGDIDGDGARDVLHYSNAFNASGSMKPGFPKGLNVTSGPVIEDFNGDGKVEAIYAVDPGYIYVYPLGNLNPATMDWPRYKHDGYGSGFYTAAEIPGITSVNPVQASPGTEISISGQGFGIRNALSKARFNAGSVNIAAEVTYWSRNLIRCRVPAFPAGNCQVSVATRSGRSGQLAFTVTANANAPVISSINPAAAPMNTDIIISGQRFGTRNASSSVRLSGVDADVVSWADGSITCKVPGVDSGNHQLTVSTTQGLSNAFAFAVTNSGAPVISLFSPSEGIMGADFRIQGINFGISSYGLQVRMGGTDVGIGQVFDNAMTCSVPNIAAGTYPVTVISPSGTSNAKDFTVYASSPAPSITSLSPSSGIQGAEVILNGQNFGQQSLSCAVLFTNESMLERNIPAQIISWNPTQIKFKVPFLLQPDPEMNWEVKVERLGMRSASANFTRYLPPVITALQAGPYSTGESATILGRSFAPRNASSRAVVSGPGGTVDAGITLWQENRVEFTIPDMVPGDYQVMIVNYRGTSNPAVFQIYGQVTPPSVTSVNPAQGATGSGVVVAGSYFGAQAGNCAVKFGTVAAVINSWSNTSVACTVPNLAGGPYPLTVVNGAGTSNAVTFTVGGGVPLPSISALNPNQGTVNTDIVITGSNFGATQGAGVVKFDITPAAINSWSASSISVKVPNLAAGVYPVAVSAAAGASNAFNFTVVAAPSLPSITSVSPNSGAANTDVTIAGSNFGATQGSSALKFGTTTAAINSWSAVSISAKVPNLAAGAYPVTLTTSAGTSDGVNFTVGTAPLIPAITSVNPSSGPVSINLTIAGSNFGATQGTSIVKFSKVDESVSAAVSSWSNASINCSVPNVPSGIYGVTVMTPAGTSNSVNFTVTVVTLPPAIYGLSPASGEVNSIVTIGGANFGAAQGTSAVKIGTSAASINTWGASIINATVPASLAAGIYPVTVTTALGTSNSANYTVVGGGGALPAITNITPPSGPLGSAITVNGQRFGIYSFPDTRVKFRMSGGFEIDAPVGSWGDTAIACSVPDGLPAGVYPVVVTNGLGASNAVNFTIGTIPSLPAITSVNPSSGPVSTNLTISGSNFGATQGAGIVRFSRADVSVSAAVSSWSNASINCSVPNAPSGIYGVTVTAPAGTSNSVNFTVTVATLPPKIISLLPNAGRVDTIVAIKGVNFGLRTADSAVRFGDTNAYIISWSDKSITFKVPLKGRGIYPVVVITPGGTSKVKNFRVRQ